MTTLRLTHIGGPTLLIEVDGWHILTDPTFDAPGRRYNFGWGTSSTKLMGPAVSVGDLPPIDIVLLSHDHHADNLDDSGRELLPMVETVVTTPSGARRLGDTARGLRPWETTELRGRGRPTLEVTATPARHGPLLSTPIAGEVVGFCLKWDGQTDGALWISGDTVPFGGLKRVGERASVGVAVLHLGQVQFGITGPVRYSMTLEESLQLVDRLQPHTVVPVHYDGWSHFQEGRAAIEERLRSAPEDLAGRYRLLSSGLPTAIAA